MRAAVRIIISYNTPHNGFRYYALQKGRELGITGTISCNGSRGGITIHAEGNESAIQKYTRTLRLGSPFCQVNSLMVLPDRILNCIYFEILQAQDHLPDEFSGKAKVRSSRIGLFGL
jgi:acylphosphatase